MILVRHPYITLLSGRETDQEVCRVPSYTGHQISGTSKLFQDAVDKCMKVIDNLTESQKFMDKRVAIIRTGNLFYCTGNDHSAVLENYSFALENGPCHHVWLHYLEEGESFFPRWWLDRHKEVVSTNRLNCENRPVDEPAERCDSSKLVQDRISFEPLAPPTSPTFERAPIATDEPDFEAQPLDPISPIVSADTHANSNDVILFETISADFTSTPQNQVLPATPKNQAPPRPKPRTITTVQRAPQLNSVSKTTPSSAVLTPRASKRKRGMELDFQKRARLRSFRGEQYTTAEVNELRVRVIDHVQGDENVKRLQNILSEYE